MADLEVSERPSFPHAAIGAASPLWAYFATAAAGGVAYWWMTRWVRPMNLEALMAMAEPVATPALAAGLALAEAPLGATEAVVEAAVAEAHHEAETAKAALSDAADLALTTEPVIDAAPVAEVSEVLEAVAEPPLAPMPEAFEEPAPIEATEPAKAPRRGRKSADGAGDA